MKTLKTNKLLQKNKFLLEYGKTIFVSILIALCLAQMITSFVGEKAVVEGSSMNPYLKNSDILWVNRFQIQNRELERYKVVIVKLDNGELLIKRIIGLPGETIQIKHGKTYINGNILKSDIYPKDSTILYSGTAKRPLTLKSDEYFCMGDNRNNSQDSRDEDIGPIKKTQITGTLAKILISHK